MCFYCEILQLFFEFGFSLACLFITFSVDINFWLLERKKCFRTTKQPLLSAEGGGGGGTISVLCVYFLVDICILAAPFLKMIYHKCVWWCLLLILSCANRKIDNLMLSANCKISHLVYKGLTDGLV